MPELRGPRRATSRGGRSCAGRPRRGATSSCCVDASKPVSLAPLGWALSRLAAGRDAVVLRGRYVVARRLAALPVIVRASGSGLLFEAVFERRAQELGIDIVGSRPRRPMPLLLRPGAALPGGVAAPGSTLRRASLCYTSASACTPLSMTILVAIVGLGAPHRAPRGGALPGGPAVRDARRALLDRLRAAAASASSAGGRCSRSRRSRWAASSRSPGSTRTRSSTKSDPMVYPNRPRWMRLATDPGRAGGELPDGVRPDVRSCCSASACRRRRRRSIEPVGEPPGGRGGPEDGRRAGRGERPAGRRRRTRSARSSRRRRARRSASRSCATASR